MADELPPLPQGAVLAQQQPTPVELPPLPAGAKLASHPDAPPLPPGAKPSAPQKSGGILSQLGEIGAAKEIYGATTRRGSESYQDIKGDLTAPVHGKKKGITTLVAGKDQYEKPGVMDYAARAGKTGMDVLGAPFNMAAGPVEATIGRVSEKYGGPKKETVGDVSAMLMPFGGEFKALGAAAKAELLPKVQDGFKAVEKVFSPTTVSPVAGETERTIRRSTGAASLQNEKAADTLIKHNATVANLPVPQQRALVDYIENRSKLPAGAKIADPKLQAAADDVAKVYDGWRQKITSTLRPNQVPNFITDYYAHIWKEKPAIVGEKLGAYAKQGSGKNFKTRSIPTIGDGIRAGLTPKFENPIESTMAYSQNMSRYVATHDMLNELKTQGYAKWYSPGSKNIPPGWVPYDGIMTKKNAPGTRAIPAGSNSAAPVRIPDRPIQLYGPKDATRVFNNFISKGMAQGDVGPFYEVARQATNGMTQLKLGLSAYHLATMANEAVISDYARAFRAASRGEFGTAAKAAGGGLANLATIGGKSAMRGLKMQRELLDKAMPDAMSKKVNDAFVRSGGSLRMDPFYRTRSSGSFFNALEKGTFKRELGDAAKKIYDKPVRGTVDLASNIIQTTAAPLFEKYIPMVKRGAFASDMEDFLKARPNATQDEIDKEAIKIADSIDNRFGELNQDNLFWNKNMKQAAQLALLSPTWTLGTLREIVGGMKDAGISVANIGKGEGLSRRSAYIAGLAANTAMMSAIYQYLKTGKGPGQVRDLMAPQTGGKDITSGQPERAMTPGYQKDVYAFGYDFPNNILNESANKLNPGLTTPASVIRNKDYAGHDIYNPNGSFDEKAEQIGGYTLEQLLPISIGQFQQKKKGTNLSAPESALGVRPAPQYITDPDRAAALKQKYGSRDWRTAERAKQRQKAQQQ